MCNFHAGQYVDDNVNVNLCA